MTIHVPVACKFPVKSVIGPKPKKEAPVNFDSLLFAPGNQPEPLTRTASRYYRELISKGVSHKEASQQSREWFKAAWNGHRLTYKHAYAEAYGVLRSLNQICSWISPDWKAVTIEPALAPHPSTGVKVLGFWETQQPNVIYLVKPSGETCSHEFAHILQHLGKLKTVEDLDAQAWDFELDIMENWSKFDFDDEKQGFRLLNVLRRYL